MYLTVFFTESGTPKTGLTPTIDVYKVSDATHEIVAQNMSEVAGGWYRYDFSGYVEGIEYVCVADAGATLGAFERYAYAGNETYVDYIDDIKAKTDNLPSGITKNVALSNVVVYMVLSSDHVTPAVGKAVTGEISKDGGAFVALTNVLTELGNGAYSLDLTQAERNADVSVVICTSLNCDQRVMPIYSS